MSSRHVWEKYNWKYKETNSSVSEGWSQATNTSNLVYSSSYSFNANATSVGRIYKLGSSYTTRDLDEYSYVDIPAGRYFKFCTSSIVLNGDNIFYSGDGCRVTRDTSSGTFGSNKITNVSGTKRLSYGYTATDLVEKFATNSSSSYTSGTVTSGYYYKYLGADSIDPKNVVYSGKVSAGENVTISVTPNANTYGGTISYLYEYSVDQGVSWVSAGTTTATTTNVAIPVDAASFWARVNASDDMGFVSSTYMYGDMVAFASKGLFATNDGVQRKLTDVPATIDGIRRDLSFLDACVAGVNRNVFTAEKPVYLDSVDGEIIGGFSELYVRRYIEASGTQYLDLDFVPNQDSRAIFVLDITKNSNSMGLLGARNADKVGFCIFTQANNVSFQSDYGSSREIGLGGASTGLHIVEKNRNLFLVDNVLAFTHPEATFDPGCSLYLFNVDMAGTPSASHFSTSKVYSGLLYQAGVLVADLAPYSQNGYTGLYNRLTSVLHTNKGTGVLGAGDVGRTQIVLVSVTDGTTSSDSTMNSLLVTKGALTIDGIAVQAKQQAIVVTNNTVEVVYTIKSSFNNSRKFYVNGELLGAVGTQGDTVRTTVSIPDSKEIAIHFES